MNKNGILKFLNPGRVKLPTLSKELSEKLFGGLTKVPGTNVNSNPTVGRANARREKEVKDLTQLVNTALWNRLAQRSYREYERNRRNKQNGVNPNITRELSDRYAITHGEITDGNQALINRALSQHGSDNALGLMTNVSYDGRHNPYFGTFIGKDTPLAMGMAGSFVANPIGTVAGLGTGYLGSQVGGSIGELLGNREAGEILGSLAGASLGGGINFNTLQEGLARGRGLYDVAKYGILDRILGYDLYNKYLKYRAHGVGDLLLDNGSIMFRDDSGTLFLQPATYTRSEVLYSGPTSMRMGFTPNKAGTKLSKDLVTQGKASIDQLPAGTIISADAHGISIPSRLSTHRGQSNVTKTLLEGTEDAETTLSRMERKFGEPFYRNPYDMSADAHRFFTLEAQKPGRELVYAGRSGKWNDAAVSNPEIYLWLLAYENGTLSARDYVNNYNNWVKDFGGRPGHVDINGKPYFYHPTIFITHKQGGKISKYQLGNAINPNWWKSPNWKSPSQQSVELWATEETEKAKKLIKKSTKPLNSAKTKAVKSTSSPQKRIEYERDWSDNFEPWALGIGLGGDVVGLYTASTGIGAPAGALIATAANLPSLGVDIYLTGRDLYRYYNDNNPEALTSGLWNGVETTLDLLGLKLLSKLNKGLKAGVHSERTLSASEKALSKPYHRVGTGAGRVMAERSRKAKAAYNAERQKALKEATDVLAKRGVRPSQGEYFMKHLTDEMAKRGYGVSVADAIRSQKQAQLFNYGLNSAAGATINIYDIYNLKQGGKMNILEYLKNGSGIHIKKKNRGKFTSYCGGKVTDSCIRRAKASGNPTLVKRATFAANARKWKH